jgi:hypothetical protein
MLAKNGSYKRRYVTMIGDVVYSTIIKVALARCTSCGKAHALLPSTVVPYSSFSIVFISHLIIDRLDKRFSSVSALCEHYEIAIHTYYRIYNRFSACVKIAYGILADEDCMRSAAHTLLQPCLEAAYRLMGDFFEKTGTSFCQPRGP